MTILFIKIFWGFNAFLSLLLGFVGMVFPIIPGIPFFILALICLEKLSPRFKQWLMKTRPMRWLQLKQPRIAGWLAK